MSNIRYAFNKAIRKKFIPSESYPFGSMLYEIKKIKKKSSVKLYLEHFEKLKTVQTSRFVACIEARSIHRIWH